jgi:hypothetical protein
LHALDLASHLSNLMFLAIFPATQVS